ncbi:MAG: RNA-binding S4 domain-containing protein [Rhodocyclaceae bacterium]|nr:RNA-binding S4 domain-containing protein [Rhodocyclaceae bacterium]
MRLDKWLWAARFFKTRSLAAKAIEAGHVHLNGAAVKPSRDVKPGDQLEITVSETRWSVAVVAINPYRRPAEEARQLYAESPESQARRAREREVRRLAPAPGSDLRGRPTKKARRQIHDFGTRD